MINGYVQNRQQPRLEIGIPIVKIRNIHLKELIISNKIDTK